MTSQLGHTVTTAVWKFPTGDSQQVEMPAGAEVLRFGFQNGESMLWARVDPEAPKVTRTFAVFGTGHPIPPHAVYVATFDDEPFVWHVFELVSDKTRSIP